MFFIDELSLLMISFWMFFLFSLQLLSLVYQLSRNGLYSMSNGNSLEWGILNLNRLLFDDWKLIRLFIVIVQSIRQYINYKGWNYCRWQSLPFNPKVCWKKKNYSHCNCFSKLDWHVMRSSERSTWRSKSKPETPRSPFWISERWFRRKKPG